MYSKFGTIKSAKVAVDPVTLKSKCYGFVWFVEESSCRRALSEAKNFLTSLSSPYLCKLFEMGGLRHARILVESEGFQTVTAINFPEDYTEHELRSIFVDAPILSCVIIPKKMLEKNASYPQVRSRAEITFRTHMHAKDACSLNGVTIGNMKLQIRPSLNQTIKKPLPMQLLAYQARKTGVMEAT
jgi:RNA recognition motif-containing protein